MTRKADPAETRVPGPHGQLPAFAPVPRKKQRSNGWKPEVQRAFIEALAETGSVLAACRRVGRSDHGAYMLRRHPEGESFRAAWDAALDFGVRRIEDAAMDRALHGAEETIHYHGDVVATRRRYNERLVMFILRNRAPGRFAEGRAKAFNAVDAMELKRLKRQWRAEWEAEDEANAPSLDEIRAGIDRKIAALRAQVVAATSPRAYELQLAAAAQVRADEAAGWRPGEPYAPYAAGAAELLPRFIEQVRAEWPSYEQAHPPVEDAACEDAEWEEPAAPEPDEAAESEPPAGPRTRTLKDGGW